MPFIILKKTNKSVGAGFSANEKAFSFHGSSVSRTIKEKVNEKLASLHRVESADPLEFAWDETIGQYIAVMNHDFQKVSSVSSFLQFAAFLSTVSLQRTLQ